MEYLRTLLDNKSPVLLDIMGETREIQIGSLSEFQNYIKIYGKKLIYVVPNQFGLNQPIKVFCLYSKEKISDFALDIIHKILKISQPLIYGFVIDFMVCDEFEIDFIYQNNETTIEYDSIIVKNNTISSKDDLLQYAYFCQTPYYIDTDLPEYICALGCKLTKTEYGFVHNNNCSIITNNDFANYLRQIIKNVTLVNNCPKCRKCTIAEVPDNLLQLYLNENNNEIEIEMANFGNSSIIEHCELCPDCF